ncbi:hypothetical protein [Methylovorus mays]|uniref:hypothetical protein n=1 Tax=Methylovorus mays TaxID=184077 RepID=UPI001E4C2414|nr:hypothetical protein [Methylovorus mays]MCB5206532.1 hypothetical protein [Methylovorus mays]
MIKFKRLLLCLTLLLSATLAYAYKVTVESCGAGPNVVLCGEDGTPVAEIPQGNTTTPTELNLSKGGTTLRIPLTTDPSKQPKAPDAPSVIDPELQVKYECYFATYGFGEFSPKATGDTMAEACAAACPGNYDASAEYCSGGSWYYQRGGAVTSTKCPEGYESNDAKCYLQDARLAKTDGNMDFSLSNANGTPVYTPLSDADFMDSLYNQPSSNQVVFGGGSTSNPYQVITSATSSGTNIQIQTNTTDGNGNSYIKTTNYSFSSSGAYQGSSNSSSAGSLTGGGAGGTYTNGSSSSGSGTNNNQVQFPNDYARSGEALEAANTINSRLDQIRLDLLNPGDSSDMASTMPTSSPLTDMFSSLSAFQVPAYTGVCPFDAQFELFNHVYSFHVACVLIENNFAIIRAAFTVLFTLAALFIVLGA